MYAVAAAVLLAGAAQAVRAWRLAPGAPPAVDIKQLQQKAPPPAAPRAETFADIVGRNFRQPHQEPAQPKAPPPPEKIKVKVVGLMIEPPNSCAVLTDDKGQRAVRGVGDTFAEMKILAIDETGVTVERGGEKLRLEVEKPQ
ncbi:MAG TPA: hypothetical protein PLT35_14045 [Vicinamibacterales bacterium]|nr:hypothetical protein [Vicinamibacterales bacterium]